MSHYEKAWQAVRDRVARAAERAGRDPAEVSLLAVSKTFGADAVRAVHACGQRAFGENYVREAEAKVQALADLPDIEWRLIGPLQTNKAAPAARVFAAVETIDRPRIAQRLSAARAATSSAPLDVLVQVNISNEATKSGVSADAAAALARDVARLPALRLRGFMGIAAPDVGTQVQRAQFRALRRCFDAARDAGLALDTLSMGMSADLEAAIAEGSTEVRVGTAIFGTRLPLAAIAAAADRDAY
ncbi:MAG: YggS family pyridoxal phosphate-dependent enzyme [Betaproteobacteria bacterium]